VRSALPVLLVVALTVYCLVNCLQSGEEEVRTLPRWGWVVVVLVLPLVGGLAYLLAGRPLAAVSGPGGGPRVPGKRRPQGPDDDDEFLRGL